MAVPAPPPLTYEQTSKVLIKLAELGEQIVLVGGQALNFWASYYQDRSSDLRAQAPFTSKDIDFWGSLQAVTQCADRLGGKAILATLDDMNTPNSGVVRFVDEDQHPRQIDFLWTVAGLREVAGVPAHVLDSNGDRIATFMVIDPVMCLRSRAHNVTRLPGYKTAHALKQLRAAIVCVREYGRDLLAQGNARATNGVNGAVFSIARFGVGVDVFVDHNIDILDALITEPGLPEKFYSHRLPYATRAVTRAREKALAAKAHSESVRARSEGR